MLKMAGGVGSGILVSIWIWFRLKIWPKVEEIWQILEPVIPKIEQAAKGGKITKDERKTIAWACVNSYVADKKITLNLIEKIIIGVVINKLAAKLPDFNIPDVNVLANNLVTDAIQNKEVK